MWELVQVTAQYSNAVLLAILPYVADFANKLELPAPTPIASTQVTAFKCDPRLGRIGGALTLTNGGEFTFLDGRVTVYRSPQSYFSLQDPELPPNFFGPVKLTETQALSITSSVISRLGYENGVFSANSPPSVTRPEKIGTNYVARYRIRWLDLNFPVSNQLGTANKNRPQLTRLSSQRSTNRIRALVGVKNKLMNRFGWKELIVGRSFSKSSPAALLQLAFKFSISHRPDVNFPS